MTTYLLDANVLIALMVEDHPHHERATFWAQKVRRFAVCPVVEGALVRLVVRMGSPVAAAQESLRLVRDRRGYEFWPDSLSYADAALDHVRGHKQVTDGYLAELARSHTKARLATLDEGLAAAFPAHAHLIPAVVAG